MNLVVLYGPPAVGKLTIGQELARITGYRLFHNHVTFDVANSVFDYGTPVFFSLCDALRLTVIESAAKSDLSGMIFTFCLATEGDQRFVEQGARLVETNGGRALFVQLLAPHTVLEERVTAISRKAYSKLMSVETLRSVLAEYDFSQPVRRFPTLHFDTSVVDPRACAAAIKQSFDLHDQLR